MRTPQVKRERHRGLVVVLSRKEDGYQESPQGRVSTLYLLRTPHGDLQWDSFAEWPLGSERYVSYSIDRGFIVNPRPIKPERHENKR